MSNWNYIVNKKELGPVSEEELKYWLNSGVLSKETLVRKEGMEEWSKLGYVLFPADAKQNANPKISALKISCRFCNGHIEFPPEYLAQTIRCPHCGEPIILNLPSSGSENKVAKEINAKSILASILTRKGYLLLGVCSVMAFTIAALCWVFHDTEYNETVQFLSLMTQNRTDEAKVFITGKSPLIDEKI